MEALACVMFYKNVSRVVFFTCLNLFAQGVIMAKPKNSLTTYRKKRDFTKTPEPKGGVKTPKSKEHIFVIHKHAATHEHYDFRIEVGGTLKSWAVPKGISTKPAEKHLAIPTENHPHDYASFEGVIPEGNYGAGTVMVWDTGTYRNIKTSDGKLVPMKECIKRGTVEVWLEGKKLHGGYALIKTKKKDRQFWLILKMKDKFAGKKIVGANKSAKSGRTMKQIESAT